MRNFVFWFFLIASCGSGTNPSQDVQELIEERIEIKNDSIEFIDLTYNLIDIKDVFIASLGEGKKFDEVKVSQRIKDMYSLSHPYNLADSLDVFRVENKGKPVWIDLILYYFETNRLDDAIDYYSDNYSKAIELIGKENGIVFSIRNVIVRVLASCSLDQNVWEYFSNSFIEIISKTDKITWKGITCRCGYICKEN